MLIDSGLWRAVEQVMGGTLPAWVGRAGTVSDYEEGERLRGGRSEREEEKTGAESTSLSRGTGTRRRIWRTQRHKLLQNSGFNNAIKRIRRLSSLHCHEIERTKRKDTWEYPEGDGDCTGGFLCFIHLCEGDWRGHVCRVTKNSPVYEA